MDAKIILFLIIVILSIDYILNSVLSYLNYKSLSKPLPNELDNIYDESDYQKSQDYNKSIYRFNLLISSITFLILLLVFKYELLGKLDNLLRSFSFENEISLSLLFFASIFFINEMILIPFQLYQNFIIEEKFGFNKMSFKTFFLDKIKSYFLVIIVGGLLISILLISIIYFSNNFWIYFWVIMSLFTVFINLFYTSLILPIFNKLKPLEDGSLKDKIYNYAKSVNFPLSNIFVIDGSKRSSKANAFFSGLGKSKKIVLYDTLIKNHSEEELVSVLAHEVGHYKNNHILSNLILSILFTGFMLFILSKFLFNSEISFALGGEISFRHFELFAFSILYSPISYILEIFMNIKSRKNEYEADNYAVTTFDKIHLINALKNLSKDNLVNLTPNPAYVFVNYSHPTLHQRIKAMKHI
tara:strand:- start:8306 stop:9544 length:1239 start_codon:yes stop_codon:yes gene_type:complete